MNKSFRILLGIISLFIFSASAVQAESIFDFRADYSIRPDSSVLVTETITYDFGPLNRHGIFRDLAKSHPQPASVWYKKRTVEYSDFQVTRNGVPENFAVTEDKDITQLKIGDPNEFVTGLQVYEIAYMIHGGLSEGPEGAEFYWNATGHDWPATIFKAVALVSGEAVLPTAECYEGRVGSTDKCQKDQVEARTWQFSSQDLGSGEGLTIAVAVDPALVSIATIETMSELLALMVGLPLSGLWSLFLLIMLIRWRTKEKIDQTVIAQYEPLQGLLPMYTGYLMDTRLDSRDITAGLIYLAEQGFLKITRLTTTKLLVFSDNDYKITLLRPMAEVPNDFLQSVLSLLFSDNAPVNSEVLLSALKAKQTKNYYIITALMAVLKKDLANNGYTIATFPRFSAGQKLLFVLALAGFAAFALLPLGIIVTISALASTFILWLFLFMPRRTRKWYEARNHLEGFKLFLSVTDKERFDFHNAPERDPELFMKYLPYAIALGVEEKWAEVFADMTLPPPDWYDGTGSGAFSAAAFTSEMNSFSSSISASASSGTSGSSGGGSAGGGGGGGGGGSW